MSLSHTTIHFHFVHFIIPHQRHISLTHNAHHLYALPLNSVTPALIRCLSLFFSHNVHSLYALPLLFRHTACSFGGLDPVPLPHSKNEFLKKPLNQVQGDISCVCRILQSTSISCISSFRINAKFLLPTTFFAFTHCSLCPTAAEIHAIPSTVGAHCGKYFALVNRGGPKPNIEKNKTTST